jgi:hypothetical protein
MKAGKACGPRRTGWFPALATRLLLGAALFLGLVSQSFAASQPDPCNSLSFKQSAAINVSSATTTNLVSAVANKPIFICGFAMSIAGSATTAASAKFEYGTTVSTACDTGAQALTGTFGSGDAAVSTTPTVVVAGDGGSTLATIPAGNQLCVVTAGNAVDVQGVVTVVQSSGASFP